MEVHNTSDSTVEFLHGQEMAYFDTRSKGLVQVNNMKHFPIDQYLHDRMTPATLSPSPLAYEKPIHPAEMPCITTHTVQMAFSPFLCFGCLLVFLFLRVQSMRWFWGMVVRGFARQDLC